MKNKISVTELFVILALLIPSNSFALEDGTLLFVENGQNLVECYTNSSYSHVAMVIDDHVYEANLPDIKKQSLRDWFTNIGKRNEGTGSPALVVVMMPKQSFSKDEISKMKTFLEEQVDRRYSIRGYLRKVPGEGIHCAEMCAGALEKSGRFKFKNQNYTYSPGDLYNCMPYSQFGKKLYVRMKVEHRRTMTARWCDWWKHTGTACGWSCVETMVFCW